MTSTKGGATMKTLLGALIAIVLAATVAQAQEGGCVRLSVTPVILGTTAATQVQILPETPGLVVGGVNFSYHVIWQSGFHRDGTLVLGVNDPARPYTQVKFSDTCPVLD
jgi:hypothetical protein